MTDTTDRISELPPFIIHHIMSYLSTKEVAQTSVLSKRWNCLRKSFPTLDFDQNCFSGTRILPGQFFINSWKDEIFRKEVRKFTKIVDTALLRFCQLKLRMEKFRVNISLLKVKKSSSLVDKWIRLAVENGVKELDVNVGTDEKMLYTLPETIFSAKEVTTLKLGSCKLEQPLDTIRLHSLKKLSLVKVYITEQMVQKLSSDCPLLEDLNFDRCCGLKCYCIIKALNLKNLTIDTPYDNNEVQRIEIVVPSLQQLTLNYRQLQRPFVVDLAGCPHLNTLTLFYTTFTDQEFHDLISKFPLLENLAILSNPFLERVAISSIQLKTLLLRFCNNLKAIKVNAPNLLSFSYDGKTIPFCSINAPCAWKLYFSNEGDLETPRFISMKKFLEKSNHVKELFVYVQSEKCLFNLDDFRESSPSLPSEVENLCLCIKAPSSSFSALLDGILGTCYPRILFVIPNSLDEAPHKFVQWLYEELKNRDANCCNSHIIQCWRHYLKAVNIESFIPFEDQKVEEFSPFAYLENENIESFAPFKDQKPLGRKTSMEMWPFVSEGTVVFRLDWCFDVPIEID